MEFITQQWLRYVLTTVSSKDHSSCAVQYALKFANELLVAASEKAVAIVQLTARCYSSLRHIKSCRRALSRSASVTLINSLIVSSWTIALMNSCYVQSTLDEPACH